MTDSTEGEDSLPKPPSRESIIAEARRQVEKQQTYFRDQAEAQWSKEKAQCRAAAALLELSRIDDEKLSPQALAEAREFRELSVNKASNRSRGPKYADKHLPEKLLNAPEVDQPTRDRVTYYTGNSQQKQRRTLKNGNTYTNEVKPVAQLTNNGESNRSVSSSVSSSSSRHKKTTRTFTKRPVEPYWHHLENGNEKGKKKEVEDDPARDPNTIIAELRKIHKHAPDPNAISLRIGRQFLRLIYGTTKTAAEVLADDIANGVAIHSSGNGLNVGDLPTSPSGIRRYTSAPSSPGGGLGGMTSPHRASSVFQSQTPLTPKPPQLKSSPSFKLSSMNKAGGGGGGGEAASTPKKGIHTPSRKPSQGGRLTPTSPMGESGGFMDFDVSDKPSKFKLTPSHSFREARSSMLNPAPTSPSIGGSFSRRGSFIEEVDKLGKDSVNKLEDNFAAKQQREKREKLKAIELHYANEARHYLKQSMEVSDPESVVDRRVTNQDVAAEERKLRAMAANEKIQYLKQKEWNRAKLIVQEREVQRLRIRSAAHELWLLELHLQNPIQARDGMKFWLEAASGENERLAALQVLHESLSKHEKLLGDFFSANKHSLHDSLGELGDLHLIVLKQLREAFPREQHYLYALGRLESKRLGHHNQRQLLEAYVDASMSDEIDQRKENKSNGYYHRLAAEKGQQAISRVGEQRAVSHWQVDVREERQALEHRDDFIRGSIPSDAHLNLTHQSAATIIHTLPQGGWDQRTNPNTGESEVGFRYEDTLKAVQSKKSDPRSQYLMEPAMLHSYPLVSRSNISTTSAATKKHLEESFKLANQYKPSDLSEPTKTSLSLTTLQSFAPGNVLSIAPSYQNTQVTGLSHQRVLEGVPTGLCMKSSSSQRQLHYSDYNSYPIMFTSVDGSAQKSLAAQRNTQLESRINTQVTSFPRRLDPKSCDFDVKNLYSTSS